MQLIVGVIDLAVVYINYEGSGSTYFKRAMLINILLIVFAAIASIYFMFDRIVLVVLGVFALGGIIFYSVYFVIVNKPIENES